MVDVNTRVMLARCEVLQHNLSLVIRAEFHNDHLGPGVVCSFLPFCASERNIMSSTHCRYLDMVSSAGLDDLGG